MAFNENLSRALGETKPVILAAKLTEQGYETSEQTVGLWLRGVREPKGEVITKIATVLGCTPNDLLLEKPERVA